MNRLTTVLTAAGFATVLSAAGFATVLSAGGADAANLVTNGTFAGGISTGWTATPTNFTGAPMDRRPKRDPASSCRKWLERNSYRRLIGVQPDADFDHPCRF